MRRVGKIRRRKVFSEVKNVNVESLKNDSKLLDFFGSLPQPLPKGKGFSISPLMSFNCLINCPINSIQFVNNSCSKKSIHGQFVNNS